MKPALAVMAAWVLACPAWADVTPEAGLDVTRSAAGHTYFNREGADLEAHDAALRACLGHAALMRQPNDNAAAGAAAAGGLLGALVVGMAQGVVQGMQQRRGLTANVENCMVAGGWRVVRLSPEAGEPLDALEQPALHDALATRVGAARPEGEIVRIHDPAAARNGAMRLGPSGDLDKISLSLQALPPVEDAPAAAPRRTLRAPRSARPPRAFKPAEIVLPPGQALVTVRLDGPAVLAGRGLLFTRAGPTPDAPAWEADGQSSLFWIVLPSRGPRGDPARTVTATYPVPPGRWRLSGLFAGQHILHFCLGSSGFEVAEGEAVYAGAFDLGGDLGPDLRLQGDPWPAEAPAAIRALAQRPAVYSHGDTDRCEGAYLYALELHPANGPVGAATVDPDAAPEPQTPVAPEIEDAVSEAFAPEAAAPDDIEPRGDEPAQASAAPPAARED